MKEFNYREFIAEGLLFKEAEETSYPKATEWLQQHPDVEVYGSVADVTDPDESDDLETSLVEAGYMFISELEAALEAGEDDDYLLSSCESGVVNDPAYNPPVDSFNY